MGIHIDMVSLYAGMPNLDMLHYSQADRQLERLLIGALSNLRYSIRSMDINIPVRPTYERQRIQLTNVSELDVNQTLCVPMGMHIGIVSLYAGIPSLDTPTYPQADHHRNAY
jgi:hypothetical protein